MRNRWMNRWRGRRKMMPKGRRRLGKREDEMMEDEMDVSVTDI